MENSLSEIDWTQLVWIPSVSKSFMQGLAHNLSIRWMDGQGHVAGGGTENAGEVNSDDRGVLGRRCRISRPEAAVGAGSSRLTNLSAHIKDWMWPDWLWATFSNNATLKPGLQGCWGHLNAANSSAISENDMGIMAYSMHLLQERILYNTRSQWSRLMNCFWSIYLQTSYQLSLLAEV